MEIVYKLLLWIEIKFKVDDGPGSASPFFEKNVKAPNHSSDYLYRQHFYVSAMRPT